MSSNDTPLASHSIDHLNHEQILAWLAMALRGQKALPRLTPDESHHLGIMRLEQTQEAATRSSINIACNELLRQFVAHEQAPTQADEDEAAYAEELLSLASMLKAPVSIARLSALAQDKAQFSGFTLAVKHRILAILADASPPQTIPFWRTVLQQDRINYAGMALAGALAVNPIQAVQFLPDMPDDEDSGEYAALNIDLAWDDLPPGRRSHFEVAIEAVLPRCPQQIAAPLERWLALKNPELFESSAIDNSLAAILRMRAPEEMPEPFPTAPKPGTTTNRPRSTIWRESSPPVH